MAMGIFEQLAWLTNKVKKLCCAIKVGALQSRNIDITTYEATSGYNITEGGIYQFYGGTGTTVSVNYAYPTSAGQTMYIINASTDILQTTGLSPADRPFGANPTGLIYDAMPDVNPNEMYQLISINCSPAIGSGFVWMAARLYPNVF